jgi:fumarate reductase flavoprotein subunit
MDTKDIYERLHHEEDVQTIGSAVPKNDTGDARSTSDVDVEPRRRIAHNMLSTASQVTNMIRTADVIVVGGGGAGLSAAISARTSGADVIVIEKGERVGGTTALSVGSFTAAATSYQYRTGVNDSPELFERDMQLANGTNEANENIELRHVLANNAGPTLEWLSTLGVHFLGPTPEPPFEKPRMHNIIPNSRAYIEALQRECERRGVTIVTDCRASQLLVDKDERIIGVRAGHDFIAGRGVILATGDYSNSTSLKAKYVSEESARVPGVNPLSTGDGFNMGLSVGAVPCNMDRTLEQLRFYPSRRKDPIKMLPSHPVVTSALSWTVSHLPKRVLAFAARSALTSWVAPENSLYPAGAILIGPRARRFANEQVSHEAARSLAAEAENRCYVFFDSRVADKFSRWPNPVSTFPGIAYAYVKDYRTYRPDVYHVSDTITGLARQIGLDPHTLEETIGKWNDAVDQNYDEDFGRTDFGAGISQPPYYALGPLGGFVTISDGGLKVDTECRVLREDGQPIRGLWAAGSTGQGGLQLVNHGLHIAWAMTSGRIAGRSAALSTDLASLSG